MSRRKPNVLVIALLAVISLSACKQSDLTSSELMPAPGSQGEAPSPTPVPTPTATPTPLPTPSPTPVATDLGICGPLDFSGVTWSSGLSFLERKAFALSLSITGSFEGPSSWATIANNSDGQGMSLGLLQQNFGQETLQPLIYTMLEDFPLTMQNTFSSSHLSSLHTMIENWGGGGIPMPDEDLFPEAIDNPLEESEVMQIMLDSVSVNWAVTNVYTDGGRTFKLQWKTEFQTMAKTQPYRTLQIQAAQAMFDKAKAYFISFGFRELRSMLLMFDFVVQNGGFTTTHRTEFQTFINANPHVTETQRAMKLLEIRLKSVRTQYVEDVRSRKSTIIHGTGTVHGALRNLPKEYCYTHTQAL